MRRMKRRGTQSWQREIQVTASRHSVWTLVNSLRGQPPEVQTLSFIELDGKMNQPVGDVVAATVSLQPNEPLTDDPTLAARVGAITDVRPCVRVVAGIERDAFDRVGMLAATNRLKYVYLTFEEPKYRQASVTSLSFSTEREE